MPVDIQPLTKKQRRIIKSELIELQLGCDTPTSIILADAVSSLIQRELRRDICLQDVTEYTTAFNSRNIKLSIAPINEIISISPNTTVNYIIDVQNNSLYATSGLWDNISQNIKVNPITCGEKEYVVVYKAGYAIDEVPQDLQNVAVEVARAILNTEGIDRSISKQSIGDWSYELGEGGYLTNFMNVLDLYR